MTYAGARMMAAVFRSDRGGYPSTLSELVPGHSVRMVFRSERTELLSARFTPKSDDADDGVLDLGDVAVAPRGSVAAPIKLLQTPANPDQITATGRSITASIIIFLTATAPLCITP